MNALTRMTSVLLISLMLAGCCVHASSPRADFTLTNKPIGPPIVGFGACMNPYLYSYPNWPAEINDHNIKDLESKVKSLHPQLVRVFFLSNWLEQDTDPTIAKNHPGMRQSLIRTIRLAQDAGAQVLLQFWYDPKRYADPEDVARRFAGAISELRSTQGLTSIRFATIQNEPNDEDKDITMDQYVHVYRAFDRALRDLHLRGDVRIIGGDLLSPHQDQWFAMLAKDLSPVLDGYSMHAYWDYWDIEKLFRRVRSVADILRAMPASQRRPIYVTEFGARGYRDNPSIEPGKAANGQPLLSDPIYSFEMGILMLETLNDGYAGTIQWDLYDAWYDRKMSYGVIGPVEQGFPLRPGYSLLKMFTHAIPPGSRTLKIKGSVEDIWITSVAAGDGRSLFLLNRGESKAVTIAGLPAHALLPAQTWNATGTGTLVETSPQPTDPQGGTKLSLPRNSITLLRIPASTSGR